jgi:hypothetical protein
MAATEDVAIWQATNGLVAGRIVEHLAAAMGGLAIANALSGRRSG